MRCSCHRLVLATVVGTTLVLAACVAPTTTSTSTSTTSTTTTTTAPASQVAGDYAVDIDGSAGTVTIATAGLDHTVSVTTPFHLEGATCDLSPGTIIATLSGNGPGYFETYSTFDTATCAHVATASTYTAFLNTNSTVTLTVAGHPELLTRTAAGVVVPTAAPWGDFNVNVNGSIGAVRIATAGIDHTVSVTIPFRLEGATCLLTPDTVIATFGGAGPNFLEHYSTFDPTTCVHTGTGSTYTTFLNTNDTVTLTVNGFPVLLTR